MLTVSRTQAIRYRLHANHLTARLPAGAYDEAARCALQDSWPRSGLVSLAARVTSCPPDAWCDPLLAQTYSPRAAVHLLPAADFDIFTVGRLPADPVARTAIEAEADQICRALGGRCGGTLDLPAELRPRLRAATASGRLLVRWDARSIRIRERPRPAIDPAGASAELARRHLHHYGPTTPEMFARWAGITPKDARTVWSRIGAELQDVRIADAPARILAADADLLAAPPRAAGLRFLPAEEMRLFEFPGTGRIQPPYADRFHPHALLVDGRTVGAWGRRGSRFTLVVGDPSGLPLEAEVATIPVPGQPARLVVTRAAA